MGAKHQSPIFVDTTPMHASADTPSARENTAAWPRPVVISAIAVCVLMSVAFYNGYPTVFSDTGSYLLTGALSIAYQPFRAPGYSVLTKLSSLETSAWFTIFMQAAIVVYVLRETCDYLIGRDSKSRDFYLLACVCVLAALTSLPWLVSLLMPDVFAGVLFLAAFLLAFAEDLNRMQRILLVGIFMISISTHMSLLPIAILFVPAIVVLKCVARWSARSLPTRSFLGWLLIPILASALCTAALNSRLGLGFRVSPSQNDFLLARLFGDGLAGDFLRENCQKNKFVSCRYLANLPRTEEDFLFLHPLLFRQLSKHQDEMDKIVSGTIYAYPLRFVASSARQTLLQLSALRTGDETRSYGGSSWNDGAIKRVLPDDLSSYLHSRQSRGGLLPLANAAAAVDTRIFWFSAAACLLLACTGGFDRINELFYSAVIFLVLNAAICATFAGVFDRYQSRVAWIMPFCLTAYIFAFVREWKRGTAQQEAAGARYQYNPAMQAAEQDTCAAAGSD
jgi:hypothetical protein